MRDASSPRYACFLESNPPASSEGPGLRVAAGVEVQLGSTPSPQLMRAAPHRTRFLGGYPLVWVNDPSTSLAAPYWCPRRFAPELSGLRPGEQAAALSSELSSALHTVRALVGVGDGDESHRLRLQTLTNAADQFLRSAFANVSGLVPLAHVTALRDYNRALIGSGRVLLGDAQCSRRYGVHNEPMARFFLHQLTAVVSLIVGQPVKPAYSYSATYLGGAVLEAHTDREQCEYTVSLLIDAGPDGEAAPWPLWLEVVGAPVAVRQHVGDAVIFAGRRLAHWRDHLPEGRISSSVLLHYVPTTFTGSLH